MTIYSAGDRTPYTYLIGWSKINLWYYGVRWAKRCHPSDLWVKYFTSSRLVDQSVEYNGQPDVIEVRMTFTTDESARKCEGKVLRKFKVWDNPNWLNQIDSTSYKILITEQGRAQLRRNGKFTSSTYKTIEKYNASFTPEERIRNATVASNAARDKALNNIEEFREECKQRRQRAKERGTNSNWSNNGELEKLHYQTYCPHCFTFGWFIGLRAKHFNNCKSLPFKYKPNDGLAF